MERRMSLGKGMAIAGIWIGVGPSAFGAHEAAIGIAVLAMLATILLGC